MSIECIYILRQFVYNCSLESFVLFNIIQMTNNLNWFESPLPKPCNYTSLPFRPDSDPDNDEQHWKPVALFSPEPILSAYKSHQGNPESPWSNLLNDALPSRDHALSIPGLLPAGSHREAFEQQLIFSEEENEEEELLTPVRQEASVKEDHSEELHTTGKKSQGEGCSGRKSRPREKGLRKLSQRAYEIVQEMKNVTYKEVAAKLVQELNEDEFESENKEEQNIKRRVYDALNVLIALGVLRKEGRKIVSDRLSRERSRASSNGSLDGLKERVEERRLAVEEKRRQLRRAEEKHKQIAFLLDRNKHTSSLSEASISFPFIGVFCTLEEAEVALSLNQKIAAPRSNVVVVRSRTALRPFGDMDSLKFLRRGQEQSEQTAQF